MNKILLEEIVKHILAGLAVIPSEFVNLEKTQSLIDKKFLLNTRITFDGDDEFAKRTGQVWGCSISTGSDEMKILLGNCSQEPGVLEFALLVQLKDSPCYGLYLTSGQGYDSEAMIACTVNGVEWLQCNTFLQASFLAGMEQLKDTGLSWNKCTDYEEEFERLLSFIQFHHLVFGESDEGQED